MKKPGKWMIIWMDDKDKEYIVQDWTKDIDSIGIMESDKPCMSILPLHNIREATFTPEPEDRN